MKTPVTILKGNKPVSKSLQRSIGKALARAARWEVRGNDYLSLGLWREAINAFQRQVNWIKQADEIRRRGSYWDTPPWRPPNYPTSTVTSKSQPFNQIP